MFRVYQECEELKEGECLGYVKCLGIRVFPNAIILSRVQKLHTTGYCVACRSFVLNCKNPACMECSCVVCQNTLYNIYTGDCKHKLEAGLKKWMLVEQLPEDVLKTKLLSLQVIHKFQSEQREAYHK